MLDKLVSTGKNSTRDGFGVGIYELAQQNPDVVALTADLAGSLRLDD
ncbi:MAG: transketolase family protein, partial [Saprospiraceae bacterium]|nr:transketolase family protein [Saprospiraceae bacterium]